MPLLSENQAGGAQGCLLQDALYNVVIRPAYQLSVTVTADGVIMDENDEEGLDSTINISSSGMS